jgi:hypothetical protein
MSLRLSLAALVPILVLDTAVAGIPALGQGMGLSCVASLPVPGSSPPANVDVLSRTSGTLILQGLGGDPLAADVVGVIVIHGTQNVAILIMRSGFACRFPLVPVADYERARRLALGVDG